MNSFLNHWWLKFIVFLWNSFRKMLCIDHRANFRNFYQKNTHIILSEVDCIAVVIFILVSFWNVCLSSCNHEIFLIMLRLHSSCWCVCIQNRNCFDALRIKSKLNLVLNRDIISLNVYYHQKVMEFFDDTQH